MGGFVEDVVGGIGDLVGGAVDAVSELGSSVDDFVNEAIPGGWTLPVAFAANSFLPGSGSLFGGTTAAEAMGPLTADALGSSFAADMAAAGFPGLAAGGGLFDESFLADMMGGMLPEYGSSGAYEAAMADAMGLPGYTGAMDSMTNFGLNTNTNLGATTPGFGIGEDFSLSKLPLGVPGATNKQQTQSFPWVQTGMGLYDMYKKNEASNILKDRFNTVNQQINALYAPGTPEYNALWQEMSRKDAAAGRNSQYGPRSVDLAAKIAGLKGNLLAQTMSPQNQLLSGSLATNASQLGSLANLFGQQTGASNALNTAIGSGVNKAIDWGVSGLKDIFNW